MVTGASGFVGSYVVAALLKAGHRPRALVRDPGRASKVLAGLGVADDAVEFVPGDMLDTGAVGQALDGCDAAVHAAAAIGITGDAGDLVATNVTGTRNVVGGAVEHGLDPVIHISTVAVFVPPRGPIITVDDPLASPRTGYGRSKVEAERYVREAQDAGAPITVLYPGGICGPGQPTLDALNEGLVAGIGKIWTCPPSGGVSVLDVRDLAEAISRCVEPGRGARRWLLGGHFLTWTELADLCDLATGRRGRRMAIPAGILRGLGSAFDVLKRVRHFDFPLTRDAAEIMTTLVPTDDTPLLDGLGVTLRPPVETISDTVRWLAAAGHLPPAKAGKLAP
jgi:nucleoside-diphosphate-sugar epimerase